MSTNSSNKLATIAYWTPILQVLLTFVIAATSGWWAYATYTGDKARLKQQQNREQYKAQMEAISQMSRQLDLMKAQCPSDEPLTILGDEKNSTPLESRCFEAYIGARSLVYLSEVQINRQPEITETDWGQLWNSLEKSLREAGNIAYNPQNIATNWKAIVENSERP